MNCWVAPAAMPAVAGVTAIDCSVGATTGTVSVTVAVKPLYCAVIVVEPAPTAVASPLALIVATPVLEELHVACAVTSPVDPSL